MKSSMMAFVLVALVMGAVGCTTMFDGGYDVTSSEQAAVEQAAYDSMVGNFISMGEAAKFFKVRLSDDNLAKLSEVPFPAKTLKECAYSHVLVPILPVSLRQMYAAAPEKFDTYCYDQAVRAGVADEVPVCGWYLVRKAWLPGSHNKSWTEQVAMVKSPDMVASPTVVTYAVIMYHESFEHNSKLFVGLGANTRASGLVVNVGLTKEGKWLVRPLHVEEASASYKVGIATMRVE